jgi:DNA-binding protein H-NS
MSGEFANLSDLELVALVHRANEELARRRDAQRETLRAEIQQKLKSAGLDLADLFPEVEGRAEKDGKASGGAPRTILAKYKNHASGESWSGRGPHPPQWVKSIMMERGWSLEEFKASEEFLAQN